jgi:hypothetical protein
MRNQFIYALVAFVVMFISSCQKEDSVLTGRITYEGAITGIEYTAPNTTVQLYLGDPTGTPYATVTTDSEGYYQFSGLWEAHWYIYSTITVNGFTYQGVVGTTGLDGSNTVTLDLKME